MIAKSLGGFSRDCAEFSNESGLHLSKALIRWFCKMIYAVQPFQCWWSVAGLVPELHSGLLIFNSGKYPSSLAALPCLLRKRRKTAIHISVGDLADCTRSPVIFAIIHNYEYNSAYSFFCLVRFALLLRP